MGKENVIIIMMTNKWKKRVSLYGPPVLWALIIFAFSAYPTAPISTVYFREFLVKKTIHIVEYGIFAALVYRALRNSGFKLTDSGTHAVLISSLYGITDEFHQSFTPGREPTVRDVVFDTIGALLAIYLIWNYLPKAPKKLKTWAKKLQLV